MNHQMKSFIPETIQNAQFLHPSFLLSTMISSPTYSVKTRFPPLPQQLPSPIPSTAKREGISKTGRKGNNQNLPKGKGCLQVKPN